MYLDKFKARLDKIISNCHEHKLNGSLAVEAVQELIADFAVRFTNRNDVVAMTVEILRKMPYPCAADCADLIDVKQIEMNWEQFDALNDEDIDFSDIPELTDDFFDNASRVPADFLVDRKDPPPEDRKRDVKGLYGLLHDVTREAIPLEKMKAWRCSWRIEAISIIEDNAIWVRFGDGLEGVVRFQPGFFQGVFSHLVDPVEFRRAAVINGAVTWPGELDLAPDAMYESIKRGNGEWVIYE